MREYAKHFRSSRLVVATLLVSACTGGDSVTQPENNLASIPWRLELNHKAITAVVGDTVQLSVIPKNIDGTTMTGLPAVVWTTSDTNIKVDATGRVVGNAAKPNVMIIAKIQNRQENWTIADTARIMVVAAPFTFSSFDLLLNGDTIVPANRSRRFDQTLYDASGNIVLIGTAAARPITHFTKACAQSVYYMSNDWDASGLARNVGVVTVRGRALIFGQTYEDSVSFRLTYPDSALLNIYRVSTRLNPSPSMMSQTDLTILLGGKVTFRNSNTTMSADIVFDDQSGVVGGNIATVPTSPAAGTAVQFPNAGVFTYRSPMHGFSGTITVVNP